MLKENRVDKIINNLIASGSDINELKKVRDKALELVNKDRSLNETMEDVGTSIKDNTEEFLYDTNKDGVRYIEGISTNVYVADFDKGDSSISVIGGKIKRDNPSLLGYRIIDNDTLFDVASITKLYTLIYAYTVETLGLDLNTQVGKIDPRYNLEDFTINDLIRLCGEIITDGRVNDAKNRDEAYAILRTACLKSNSRLENKYTDIGAMIIADVVTRWLNNRYNTHYTFEKWINDLVFEPMNLKNTMYNPNNMNITGNGNNRGVHDPKAKAFGGVAGHAGIFTNSSDLEKLARGIFAVNNYARNKMNGILHLTREQIARFGEITFPNAKQSNKGNLGLYVKHPLGFDKTFTPSAFSTGSFSHQGWTGALATFDPNNQIHQSILVNAIYESDDKDKVRNDKPVGYGGRFDKYLATLTDDTMIMFIAKKYFDTYINKNNMDNSITFKI